jgi:hypothetical protein
LLHRQEAAEHAVVPGPPLLAADLVYGVRGIGVAVPEVFAGVEVLLEESECLADLFRFVLASQLEDAHARSGAGEAGRGDFAVEFQWGLIRAVWSLPPDV